MSFRIMAVEVSEAILNDGFLKDDLEKLPGGYFCTIENLNRAKNGESYFIIDENGNDIEIEPLDDFGLYFEYWENYHYFGLPNGGGWYNELPWVIEILKVMQKAYNDVQDYRLQKK